MQTRKRNLFESLSLWLKGFVPEQSKYDEYFDYPFKSYRKSYTQPSTFKCPVTTELKKSTTCLVKSNAKSQMASKKMAKSSVTALRLLFHKIDCDNKFKDNTSQFKEARIKGIIQDKAFLSGSDYDEPIIQMNDISEDMVVVGI